jgi:hypothetical protein
MRRFALMRTNVVPTGQNVRLPHATPDAARMTIARSNIGTSTAIAIAIVHMTTNAGRQSTLVSSALVIATGRMTVTTISLKS